MINCPETTGCRHYRRKGVTEPWDLLFSRQIAICNNKNCSNNFFPSLVKGHVHVQQKRGTYITPLCHSCNDRYNTSWMNFRFDFHFILVADCDCCECSKCF